MKTKEKEDKKIEKVETSKEEVKDVKKAKTSEKKKVSPAEFEKKVIELADKGITSEKIGETLRQQGIHSKEFEKSISQILKEKGKYINPDLKNIESKLERIKKHLEKNKGDKRALRENSRVFSQLRTAKKHFGVAIN